MIDYKSIKIATFCKNELEVQIAKSKNYPNPVNVNSNKIRGLHLTKAFVSITIDKKIVFNEIDNALYPNGIKKYINLEDEKYE
jgi:hypothetical protein